MSRMAVLQECDQALQKLFPTETRPLQKGMARAVVGVVLSKSANLSQVSAAIPGDSTNPSKYRRLQRLLANPRWESRRTQRRLAARILAGQGGRIDVLLDATTTGATAHHPGTVTISFALAWHGRALPLLWRTWRADEPGQDWTGAWEELSGELAAVLPPACQVVVMADRGMSGAELVHLARRRGWHYLLRITGTGPLRLPDGTGTTARDLLPGPNQQVLLSDVLAFAPRRKAPPSRRQRDGHGLWEHDWTQAVPTNLVAVWRATDPEPWLLVTDLPAVPARCAEYRHRTWQEELFRDLKSCGWNWQRCRVRQPERVERLLLLLALATVWAVCLAQRLVRRGHRALLEPASRRIYSCFHRGLRFLDRCLANDRPIPVLFSLWREPPRPLKLS